MLSKAIKTITKKAPTLKRAHHDDVLCAIDCGPTHSTAIYQYLNGKLEVRSVQNSNTLRQLLSVMRASKQEVQSADFSRLLGHYLNSSFSSASDKWIKDGDLFDYCQIKSKQVSEIDAVTVIDPSYFENGCFKESLFARHFQSSSHPLSKQLKSARFFVCPIVHKSHYYLLLVHQIEPNTFKMGCLDGFNDFKTHQLLFAQAKRCLKFFMDNDDIEVDSKSYLIPRQNNIVDCGVVAAYYVEKFCDTVSTKNLNALDKCFSCYEAFSDTECDYSLFRSQIAHTVLKETVLHLEEYPCDANKSNPAITPARRLQSETSQQVVIIDADHDSASTPQISKHQCL